MTAHGEKNLGATLGKPRSRAHGRQIAGRVYHRRQSVPFQIVKNFLPFRLAVARVVNGF